jgi:hypothetical protein
MIMLKDSTFHEILNFFDACDQVRDVCLRPNAPRRYGRVHFATRCM